MSDESLNNGPDREEQRPGGAVFSAREMQASAAGSSSVGAGCARGRGFDVEEYAERIYRANINLALAEVPRDYFKPTQDTRLLTLTEENSFKAGADRV
jgi:hypothetical protein